MPSQIASKPERPSPASLKEKRSLEQNPQVLEARAAIQAAAANAIGSLSLVEAIRVFRNELVDCAIRQSNGSRRAAARILGVTRPAIQNVLRRSDASDSNVKKTGDVESI
jgi:DNA-binding NtrC family response regulator